MATFTELCGKETILSSVQIGILERMLPGLSFVADLARGNLHLYVPSETEQKYLPAYKAQPGKFCDLQANYLPAASLQYLLTETFRTGKAINQWEESAEGGAGIRSFPIKDLRSNVIAVGLLFFRLTMPMSEYAHLLHSAETIFNHGQKLAPEIFAPLNADDGIIIADGFHRIVFADEMARLIYRSLGVGSLVGRLLDDELTGAVDREVRTKKKPWEREMYAGKRVLCERRLDFTEGGNSIGHIVILSDITEKRRREQDAKVQEALMQRIQELEEELNEMRDSLETRKILDRAKGILMAEHNITEDESYRRIQRQAMMKRMTIKEVAESILRDKQK